METSNFQTAQIIEEKEDMPVEVSSLGGNKTCGGAACDFSDSNTSSIDAKERSASTRKLLVAIVLYIIFMGVEVARGIKANSLAILTDAAIPFRCCIFCYILVLTLGVRMGGNTTAVISFLSNRDAWSIGFYSAYMAFIWHTSL